MSSAEHLTQQQRGPLSPDLKVPTSGKGNGISKSFSSNNRVASGAGSSRDAERGIKNVSIKKLHPDGEGGIGGVGPLQQDLERKGIAARAYRRKERRGSAEAAREETDAEYEDESGVEQLQKSVREQAVKRMQKQSAAAVAKKLSVFARGMSLSVVWTVYGFQLVCALISLVGLGIHGYLLYLKNETLWGKVASVFVSFDEKVPALKLGLTFLGLSNMIVFALFFALLLWYFFTGVKVFKGVGSTAFVFLMLAASLLPGLNIVPWLPLWATYVSTTSLFETGKVHLGP